MMIVMAEKSPPPQFNTGIAMCTVQFSEFWPRRASQAFAQPCMLACINHVVCKTTLLPCCKTCRLMLTSGCMPIHISIDVCTLVQMCISYIDVGQWPVQSKESLTGFVAQGSHLTLLLGVEGPESLLANIMWDVVMFRCPALTFFGVTSLQAVEYSTCKG